MSAQTTPAGTTKPSTHSKPTADLQRRLQHQTHAIAKGVPARGKGRYPIGRDQNDTAAHVTHTNASMRLIPQAPVQQPPQPRKPSPTTPPIASHLRT
jgi:hypothetical protein